MALTAQINNNLINLCGRDVPNFIQIKGKMQKIWQNFIYALKYSVAFTVASSSHETYNFTISFVKNSCTEFQEIPTHDVVATVGHRQRMDRQTDGGVSILHVPFNFTKAPKNIVFYFYTQTLT
jgi:hypothetical protein